MKVKSSKSVRDWFQLVQTKPGPFHQKLYNIYDGNTALIEESEKVCMRAVQCFGDSFGWDKEIIIVRSTGRVNLMGMHIEHQGGAINPVAIKELFFLAEPRHDDLIIVRNVETDKFPEEKFCIHDCLSDRKIENWDAWCHDEFERRKTDNSITWSNYIRAAVLHLQHKCTNEDGKFHPKLKGMNVVVYGNIPQAAGLSSSSAMVVAAAEACIRINNLEIEPFEFVDICGYGEWYVGTRGGAGDHAAIKFGQPDSILHMKFFPLKVEPIRFPIGYKIVLANSMVEAKKQEGARNIFNNRVASYTIGLLLVQKNFLQYADKLEHLRDINPQTLGVEEAEIYHIIKSIPEFVTRKDIKNLLPEHNDELQHIFRSHEEPIEGYKIRQVCLYGITECIRAELAVEYLKKSNIRDFGELINISHDGDRVTNLMNGKRIPVKNTYPDERLESLISDIKSDDSCRKEKARLWRQSGGYNCSIPELDMLVDIAKMSPGVLGAGLVGAGLGGSIVIIVEEKYAQKLLRNLANEYYYQKDLPIRAEIVVPVGGGGVLDI
jgi:N-acetylgalactosamine kinase